MDNDPKQVRLARRDDLDHILAVHRDAFGGEEGIAIARLVEEMLADPTAEPIYSFVAESKQTIVGHVLFTSVKIESKNTDVATAQILAPLAVARDRQGEGIGTQLVKEAFQHPTATGIQLVFVLGYPDYYSRFGFITAGVCGFQAPYPIPEKNADAWMVLDLEPDAAKPFAGTVQCCEALDHQKYWVE